MRYAAEEVEKAVLAILRRLLNSPAGMLAALAMKDLSPGTLERIVGQAKALADDLKDHHTAHQISSEVIDKVIIHQDALELRLQREKLAGLLGAESRSEDPE